MDLKFFENQNALRKWFKQYHRSAKELFLAYYKVRSGRPSVSWPQSVDEALCFGWIDGLRKSIDDESYYIRFSPRKDNSIWSAINIKKVAELEEKGLMMPAGLAAFDKRKEEKSKIYSYEKAPVALAENYQQLFQENNNAWKFFQSQTPSYKKPAINWVMSAKQEVTRQRRLQELINDSAHGRKIKSLSYGK